MKRDKVLCNIHEHKKISVHLVEAYKMLTVYSNIKPCVGVYGESLFCYNIQQKPIKCLFNMFKLHLGGFLGNVA